MGEEGSSRLVQGEASPERGGVRGGDDDEGEE